jgi:hypothetical protein
MTEREFFTTGILLSCNRTDLIGYPQKTPFWHDQLDGGDDGDCGDDGDGERR